MKYLLVTICLTLLLVSKISCDSTCDIEQFRTCYLNAETDAEEEVCLNQPGCEKVAEDFRHPLEIGVPKGEGSDE